MFLNGKTAAIALLCASVVCAFSRPVVALQSGFVQPPSSPEFREVQGQDFALEYSHDSGMVESESTIKVIDSSDGLDASFVWMDKVKNGYDGGFLIASQEELDLEADEIPFQLRFNGWGQLRNTVFDSEDTNPDQNQFQLKRARLVFSGHAYTSDFKYFFQLDGRSSSGDDIRLLDYCLSYDLGHHDFGLERGKFGFRTGKWKMPFTMARYLSGRELEFSDRSIASMFFDVNRSFGWGLYGQSNRVLRRLHWEVAVFNGLVTGGAETGSAGTLDNNFAYSGRVYWHPMGDWGKGELADFQYHDHLATRVGAGFANSTIERSGTTEFSRIRVVDSGIPLVNILPATVDEYTVNIYALDASMKYRGWSCTFEYYFRLIDEFRGGPAIPNQFDHGHWLQIGKFVVPGKLQLLSRWSRVAGESGTLGTGTQSSDEVSGGLAWYFHDQQAKLTVDATYLDGAPINSSALNVTPGDIGWLVRTQIQFAF